MSKPALPDWAASCSAAAEMRSLKAFMISMTKTVSPVMAKCRGIIKKANGAAVTTRRSRINAVSMAYPAAISPGIATKEIGPRTASFRTRSLAPPSLP